MIKITTKNFDKLINNLEDESKNVFEALVKTHSIVSANASKTLKRGLSFRAGRTKSDSDYRTSPVGSMPYAHSMRLRNSIGFKIMLTGNKVSSEVGSGAMTNYVEYSETLEGEGHGIRPFLWYIDNIFNTDYLQEKFNEIYKPKLGSNND